MLFLIVCLFEGFLKGGGHKFTKIACFVFQLWWSQNRVRWLATVWTWHVQEMKCVRLEPALAVQVKPEAPAAPAALMETVSHLTHNRRKCTFCHAFNKDSNFYLAHARRLISSMSAWRNSASLAIQNVPPAKIQISLRIRAGWSESSLGHMSEVTFSYVVANFNIFTPRFFTLTLPCSNRDMAIPTNSCYSKKLTRNRMANSVKPNETLQAVLYESI